MKRLSDVFLDTLSLIVKSAIVIIFIVPITAAFLLVVPTALMLLEDKDRN